MVTSGVIGYTAIGAQIQISGNGKPHEAILCFNFMRGKTDMLYLFWQLQIVMDVLENKQWVISRNGSF